MGLQIFGTRKCQDTKKARRFFSDRKVDYQFVDLEDKGISPGELKAVLQALPLEDVMDSQGRRYRERGLAHMLFDPEEELAADPGLLRTPIVRDGKRAACGNKPELWASFL